MFCECINKMNFCDWQKFITDAIKDVKMRRNKIHFINKINSNKYKKRTCIAAVKIEFHRNLIKNVKVCVEKVIR